MQRIKKHEIKAEKQNYRQHIIRLQKLKEGQSPDQVRRSLEKKRIAQLLSNIRRFHNQSKSFRMKQIEALEQYEKSKQKDYSKVESVIKNDLKRFDQLALTSVQKSMHVKKTGRKQNKLGFSSFHITKNGKFQQNVGNVFDFSKIYEKSKLSIEPQKQIKIKLGKGPRIVIQFQMESCLEYFKDLDEFFLVSFFIGKKTYKTDDTLLKQLIKSKIHIQLPCKSSKNHSLQIIFCRLVNTKQIVKAEIEIERGDFEKDDKEQNWKSLSPHEILLDQKLWREGKKIVYLTKNIKGTPKKLNLMVTLYPSKKLLQNSVSFYHNSLMTEM